MGTCPEQDCTHKDGVEFLFLMAYPSASYTGSALDASCLDVLAHRDLEEVDRWQPPWLLVTCSMVQEAPGVQDEGTSMEEEEERDILQGKFLGVEDTWSEEEQVVHPALAEKIQKQMCCLVLELVAKPTEMDHRGLVRHQ